MREPVRVRFTRDGRRLVWVGVAVAFAAANTANNLLYLLFALLVAALPVSSLFARASVRRLSGRLLVPSDPRAGVAATAVVDLECANAPFGAVAVVASVENADPPGPAGLEPVADALTHVPARAQASLAVPLHFQRRGAARVALRVRSSFPFGAREASRVLDVREVLVLPRAERIAIGVPSASPSGAVTVLRRGEGADVLDVREWRAGDDARRMHWKATARLDRPMVREHAADEERRAVIVVDAGAALADAGRASSDPGVLEQAALAAETAISRAAGAAEQLEEQGWTLRLVAPGVDVRGSAMDVARALALLDERIVRPQGWWRGLVGPSEAVVLVTARAEAADAARLTGATDGARLTGATDAARLTGATDGVRLTGATDAARATGATP